MRIPTSVVFVVFSAAAVAAQQTPVVTLVKASLAAEITNDQTVVLVPAAGQRFLWVTMTTVNPTQHGWSVSGVVQTFDLTKVAVAVGAESYPLIGVDSAWDGDPKQFSMIATATKKTGGTIEPLEETRSIGTVSFAFTPGQKAILKILIPPQSVCLLFSVPDSFKTGQVQGLSGHSIALPALAK